MWQQTVVYDNLQPRSLLTQEGREGDVDPEDLGEEAAQQLDDLAPEQRQDDEDQEGEDGAAGRGDGPEDGPGREEHGAGGEDQRQIVGHLSSEAVNNIGLYVWYLASTRALFKCKRLKLNMFPRPV